MPMFRKRTFASVGGSRFGASNGTRAFKKRRFTRNSRFRKRTGGSRTTGYTSLNIRDHTVGFRGRKTSRRAYKRHIWNSTKFKTHYRSILTASEVVATPANPTQGVPVYYNMYNFGPALSPFWTVAGGAQEIDLGDGVPEFGDEIVLRGGKFEITFQNTGNEDIKIKLYRITTGNNPDLTLIPSGLGVFDKQWDPSVVPDFYTQFGKPFMSKEVVIEQGNSYTFVTRFKSQKIDQNAYDNSSRSPFVMMLISGNVGVGGTVLINRGYSLAFSGDVSALAP